MQFEDQTTIGESPDRSNSVMARVSAIGTAVILVGFLVMTVSRAAFVATTENVNNFAESGELTLTDNDAENAMFPDVGTVLASDGVMTSCIDVIYDGDYDPEMIKLYAQSVSGDLAPHLNLKVELGTTADFAADFDDCTGFDGAEIYSGTLAAFGANVTDYASGINTWQPTAAADLTRSFRFTVSVAPVNGGGAGTDASFGFTWETQGG